ncbi:MAG: hypothetical protein AAGF01_02435 [Cyanobacteria bacterium P01_G01_bin.38]
MSTDLRQVIERILSGCSTETDLQTLLSAISAGQIGLATGEQAVAFGGNTSNSVIVTGDNNQVILLKEEDANALEDQAKKYLESFQFKNFQSRTCQNRQALDRYLEKVLNQLEELGNPEILKDETVNGRWFNYIVRLVDFEPGLGMRGEAFFMMSEFASMNLNTLKRFSTQASQWARTKVDASAAGQALFNFRVPTHLCFAIALVDQVDASTAAEIQTTNPFKHRVDLMWYEIPVVYELDQQRLLYYSKASNFLENFRGEIVWQPLRKIITSHLSS